MSPPAAFLEVLFCLMLHTEFFRTHLAGTSRTLVLGLSYLSVNGENIHQLEQDKSGPEVPVAISTDVLSLLWFSVFPIPPLTVFLPPYFVSCFQKKPPVECSVITPSAIKISNGPVTTEENSHILFLTGASWISACAGRNSHPSNLFQTRHVKRLTRPKILLVL